MIMNAGSSSFIFGVVGLVIGVILTLVLVVVTGFGAGKKAEKLLN